MKTGTRQLRAQRNPYRITNRPRRDFSRPDAVRQSIQFTLIRVKPASLRSFCFLLLNFRIPVNPTKSQLKFKTQPPALHTAFPPSQTPQHHIDPTYPNLIHRGIPTRNIHPPQAPRNQPQLHPIAPSCSRRVSATGIELPQGRKRHRMPSMSPLRHCQNQYQPKQLFIPRRSK
jgi:hypothetical protein